MTADAAAPPRRRRFTEVLAALRQPKVAVMLALGFSSGLPFMLIGNTLGFWLADAGIRIAAIGFMSWAGLTYVVKFVWGAMVDRVRAPLASGLGRRRSWMLLAQLVVAVGLVGMACCDPRASLTAMAAFAVVTGVGAATQDTVIDAWRIESAADPDEMGLLAAAYSLGFRAALFTTEALILLVAQAIGWPLTYAVYGAAMVVGLAATFCAREPLREGLASGAAVVVRRWRGLFDAVIGPIIGFLRQHGASGAALMLAMITLYHLCDFMRGPMVNPYYVALGISKETIFGVRSVVSLPASLLGIALGGVLSLRLGNIRILLLGAFLQPIAVGAFAVLGWHGGDFDLLALGPVRLTAFEAIMAFNSIAMSFSGVALVAYMSTLTSRGFTATQYALLASAMTLSGKTLKGFSGAIVEQLQPGRSLLDAYALFYLLSAAVGVPAILACIAVAVLGSEGRAGSPQRA